MATVSNEADEVRRQMAKIRRELRDDVREVVASAEAVTDWRRYLQMYPWTVLGLTFAVGYTIIPKRRVPRNVATRTDVDEVREVVEESQEKKPKTSILGTLFGIVGPVAVRVAQGYAVQYLEGWLAQQMQQQMMKAGPPPTHPQAPGGPGHTGGPGRPGGAR